MNFLAHVYLSFDVPKRQIGNFIADTVKGKDYLNFTDEIQLGILLHRKIDSFTDAHPIFRRSVRRLFARYRHYSPVIIDMFYDHFLAKHFERFHEQNLECFIQDFYQVLAEHLPQLPERTQKIAPILFKENWFLKYKTLEGLKEILVQMDRRRPNKSEMHTSIDELIANYSLFEEDFLQFIPLIKAYSIEQTFALGATN